MREREVRKGGFDGKNVLDLCMAGYSHLALDKKSKLKMGDCFRNAKHGIISNMICNLVRFCFCMHAMPFLVLRRFFEN